MKPLRVALLSFIVTFFVVSSFADGDFHDALEDEAAAGENARRFLNPSADITTGVTGFQRALSQGAAMAQGASLVQGAIPKPTPSPPQ